MRAPEKVPDLIGLKGDTSDSIAGVPGIGDKTAAQLIQQFDSVEGVLEHVDELSPARARSLREHADQARESKVLATMRRDLDIDCDPGSSCSRRPTVRAAGDVPPLRVPGALAADRPAGRRRCPRPRRPVVAGEELSWREGELWQRPGPSASPPTASAARWPRTAVGSSCCRRLVRPCRRRAKSLLMTPSRCGSRRSTTRPRGVPHRARTNGLRAHRSRRRVRDRARSLAARRGGDGGARPPRGAAAAPGPAHACTSGRARPRPTVREHRASLTGVLARMEDAGVKIDTYRMGEITARLRERVEEREGRVRAGGRGVHARFDPAGRARALRAAGAHAWAQGEDGLLHRHARPGDDP